MKQLYLGYHSYNLRLFVGETRENFREELSWSADGSKGVSLRVNDENPEKLTMRFDEKVLEVLERTNITTVTLLNKSGAAVMQYNVSDLRAAYDRISALTIADQLVVGGADDDVMKIGADGQLVPVESTSKCCLSGEDETAHRETEGSIKTGELSGEGSAALLFVFVSVLYRKRAAGSAQNRVYLFGL